MKRSLTAMALIGGVSLLGFMVGFGIGQKTRQATPGHVKTDFSGGKVTIQADVTGAVSTGAADWLGGFLK